MGNCVEGDENGESVPGSSLGITELDKEGEKKNLTTKIPFVSKKIAEAMKTGIYLQCISGGRYITAGASIEDPLFNNGFQKSENQQWIIDSTGEYIIITNSTTKGCIFEKSKQKLEPVETTDKKEGDSNMFLVLAPSPIFRYYFLQHKKSHQVVGLKNGNIENGAKLVWQERNDEDPSFQLFRMTTVALKQKPIDVKHRLKEIEREKSSFYFQCSKRGLYLTAGAECGDILFNSGFIVGKKKQLLQKWLLQKKKTGGFCVITNLATNGDICKKKKSEKHVVTKVLEDKKCRDNHLTLMETGIPGYFYISSYTKCSGVMVLGLKNGNGETGTEFVWQKKIYSSEKDPSHQIFRKTKRALKHVPIDIKAKLRKIRAKEIQAKCKEEEKQRKREEKQKKREREQEKKQNPRAEKSSTKRNRCPNTSKENTNARLCVHCATVDSYSHRCCVCGKGKYHGTYAARYCRLCDPIADRCCRCGRGNATYKAWVCGPCDGAKKCVKLK